MTPRPDLDIGFAGEPNHPRERRQEGQEPDRIGELEVQSGQSDISIDLLNGLGASYVARLNKPAKKRGAGFLRGGRFMKGIRIEGRVKNNLISLD
jgi:hypothetical protein